MSDGDGKTRPGASRAPLAERKSAQIEAIMGKYPVRRSGVMDLLWLVQEEEGWISPESMAEVAEVCGIQPSEVMEMVTFYTMYHRQPVGRFVLGVCATLPCALCGAEGLLDYLKEKLGAGLEERTPDGVFTLRRVECLGACSEAPLMLVNKKLATRLTRAKVDQILQSCREQAAEERRKAGARAEA
jgi:NADH-quinone oxidoreductase subunit E